MSSPKERKKLMLASSVQKELKVVWQSLPQRRNCIDVVVWETISKGLLHELNIKPVKTAVNLSWCVISSSQIDYTTFSRSYFTVLEQCIEKSTETAIVGLLKRALRVVESMLPIALVCEWGILDDDGNWTPFPPEVTSIIETQFMAEKDMCIIDLGDESFVIDFSTNSFISTESETLKWELSCKVSIDKKNSFNSRRKSLFEKKELAARDEENAQIEKRGAIETRPLAAEEVPVWSYYVKGAWKKLGLKTSCVFELCLRDALCDEKATFEATIGNDTFSVDIEDPLRGAIMTSKSLNHQTQIRREVIKTTAKARNYNFDGPQSVLFSNCASKPLMSLLCNSETEARKETSEFLSCGVATVSCHSRASDSIIHDIEELLNCGIPASAIALKHAHISGTHEVFLHGNWVPLPQVNEWLWSIKSTRWIFASRWCPIDVTEMAAMVDGEWTWVRRCGQGTEYIRFVTNEGEPMSVKRSTLEKTAFPKKFLNASQVIHLAMDRSKLRSALDLYESLIANDPNLDVQKAEESSLHLNHVCTFLGINIHGAVAAAKIRRTMPNKTSGTSWSMKEEELDDDLSSEPDEGSQKDVSKVSKVAVQKNAVTKIQASPPKGTGRGKNTAVKRDKAPPSSPKVSVPRKAEEVISVLPEERPVVSLKVERKWTYATKSVHAGVFDILMEQKGAKQEDDTLNNFLPTDYRAPRKQPTGQPVFDVCHTFFEKE